MREGMRAIYIEVSAHHFNTRRVAIYLFSCLYNSVKLNNKLNIRTVRNSDEKGFFVF